MRALMNNLTVSKQIKVLVYRDGMNGERRQVKACIRIGSPALKMHCSLYQIQLRALLKTLELIPMEQK